MDLELQYSPSRWSHRVGDGRRFGSAEEMLQHHLHETATASAELLREQRREMTVYGSSSEERMYIFSAAAAPENAPIFVYIHGGYWQMVSVEDSCYAASTFTKAGAKFVALGYQLASQSTMEEIVEQVTQGLLKVLLMAKDHNSQGVYVCGHSAGAHLAVQLASVDWWDRFEIESSWMKSVYLVSGIYDLRPLIQTTVNDALQLDLNRAGQLSPVVTMSQPLENKVVVIVGEHDSPEFKRQSKEFADKQTNSEFIIMENRDHFDVIEDLKVADSKLIKLIVEDMKLNF